MKRPHRAPLDDEPTRLPLPIELKAYLGQLQKELGSPFDPDGLMRVLVGLRGSPKVNLVRALGELADARHRNGQEGPRRTSALENLQLGHIKALLKAFRFNSEERRSLVLAVLEEERRDLDAPRRVRGHRLAKLGITQPKAAASRQLFWSYPIRNLVEHLEKMGVSPEKDRFQIVARLLHLFSAGLFPDSAARVKARYYRSL